MPISKMISYRLAVLIVLPAIVISFVWITERQMATAQIDQIEILSCDGPAHCVGGIRFTGQPQLEGTPEAFLDKGGLVTHYTVFDNSTGDTARVKRVFSEGMQSLPFDHRQNRLPAFWIYKVQLLRDPNREKGEREPQPFAEIPVTHRSAQ